MEAQRLVFFTFPDRASARQIGTLLIERQLAAYVNLVPSIPPPTALGSATKSEFLLNKDVSVPTSKLSQSSKNDSAINDSAKIFPSCSWKSQER